MERKVEFMQLGAQLFTVRDFMQTPEDMEKSLTRIRDIGYRIVQVSAIGPIEPQRLRDMCDRLSLKIVITHTNTQRIFQETQAVIEEHNVYGCDYIGIGALPPEQRSAEFVSGPVMHEAARAIKAAGKLLMYHNHDFEFEKGTDKKTFFDHLIEGFGADELGFTLDTFWVQAGGLDVCDLIDRLKGRLPCVHLKDMAIQEGQRIMTPVMDGNMSFPKIIQHFEQAGTQYLLVEQDTCQGDPFDCLETSYRNLTTLNLK